MLHSYARNKSCFNYHILSFYSEKALYIGVARNCKKCYTYDGMQADIGK